MSEPRRGRPPHRYAIHRARLVNFHNLVDETLEIREGGHLFLLGDNGSGKTTVLDAIHLALTGALDVELNAAARVVGGRDAGRTLQGIVLRYDPERGPLNEGGQIAYALLELLDATEGAVMTVGVGIAATTMDADVSRWAVVHRGTLESVPIVEDTPAGRVPASRDALRAGIGKLDFFGRMSEYRKALAERLFGGEALYEEVCRFWSMAKAYREIVSRARDFAGLFVRLLPAPDMQVFEDILRSLRALDELEGLVEQLERQERYLTDVAALVEEIRGRREDLARYRWLATFRRRAEASARRQRTAFEVEERRVEADRAQSLIEARRGDHRIAVEAVRVASERDPEGLLGALARADAELERAAGEAGTAAFRLGELERDRGQRERTARDAFDARASTWLAAVSTLDRALPTSPILGHPLDAVRAAGAGERRHANSSFGVDRPAPLPDIPSAAYAETDAAWRAALTLEKEREHEVARTDQLCAERERTARALRGVSEETPDVPGFAAARAALTAASVRAIPLYELLDPKPTAPATDLAALESLAGDAGLATFVVAQAQLAATRARALPHDGARVFVRTATDAPLPGWVESLFSVRTPPDALSALGTILSQAGSLGPLAAPDALGDVEHRGTVARPVTRDPRLIGAEARRQAHAARLRAAERELEEAAALARAARAARDDAAGQREAAEKLEQAVVGLRSRELIEAHAKLEGAFQSLDFATQRCSDARAASDAALARRDQSAALVETLKLRIRDAGIEELDRHVQRLRETERAAERTVERAREDLATVKSQLSQSRRDLETQDAGILVLDAEAAERTRVLRAALGDAERFADDRALEHHVRVERRGDQFRSIENVEEAARDAERSEAVACHELERDGSRGVRCLEWAGRFGLTWSIADLRVEDRRGEPLASVLTELQSRLTEQREVVSGRTRELMETLVMGDLARELQEQVERLSRTVREMNGLLDGIRFGTTRYQFKVVPRSDTAELVALVRQLSLLDEASRTRFREFVDARLGELRQLDQDSEIPDLLDYRRWFEYRLSMRSRGEGDTELTRELRALGSGGEQGVPNYLLVLALAKLMFDNAGARVRPLFFDEAFYGIDAGRRDQLLRFATVLGLQLVVASPDQDGVTPSASRTTTVFLVKDENADVHLAPYHYWNDMSVAQTTLFAERAEAPDPSDAVCIVGTAPAVTARMDENGDPG